jgi:hypothetical protein
MSPDSFVWATRPVTVKENTLDVVVLVVPEISV